MASGEISIHEEIARRLADHPANKGVRFNVAVTAVEVGGAIALFQVARRLGVSDVGSYLAGSIGPVVGGILVWVKARRFSGASAAIFGFTAVSSLVAVAGSAAPKVLLYKDCAATALVGLIFLGSCLLARKPIVFYMAQRYGTDGTHEGMSTFDVMWDTYREFRTSMYVISFWWAGLFLVQAAGTAVIIRDTRYSTGYTYDQILPLVATGLGIAGSVLIGRHYTRKGRARGAAHAAAITDGTDSTDSTDST